MKCSRREHEQADPGLVDVVIAVTTADGRTKTRRFVPSMARSEFVLSPYVADTAGLRALFPDQAPPSSPLAVTAIRISATGGGRFWQPEFTVRLRGMALLGQPAP